MFLTEFFNSPEGDSYANHKATKNLKEAKLMSTKEDSCGKSSAMGKTTTKVDKKVSSRTQIKEDSQGVDTVSVDVPLLIRLLEYAREDAKTDMDLHNVAERAIALSQQGRTLTMDDYNEICNTKD